MNNSGNLSHPFSDKGFLADNRKVIVLKEKGKEYRALNDAGKSCVILQIDGNIINSFDSKKCDKGLIVIDDNKFYLVELKGIDVSTACKQLLSTLKYFEVNLKSWNYEYYCRSVVAEMPAPRNYPSSYKMLLKKLKNDKEKLICKSTCLEERI